MNTHKKGALPGALSNSTQAHHSIKTKSPSKLEFLFLRIARGDRWSRFQSEIVGIEGLNS